MTAGKNEISEKTNKLVDEFQNHIDEQTKVRIGNRDLGEWWETSKETGVILKQETYNLIKYFTLTIISQKEFNTSRAIEFLSTDLKKEFLKNELLKSSSIWIEQFRGGIFFEPYSDFFNGDIPNALSINFPPDKYISIIVNRLNIIEKQKYIDLTLDEIQKWTSSNNKLESVNIPLPKFQEITNYLAFLKYHSYLRYTYRVIDLGIDKIETTKKYQIQTDLKTIDLNKIKKLYEQLIEMRFISLDTKENDFFHVFGEPLGLKSFESVKWIESKTALRELLTYILKKITNQHIRDIEKLFLNEFGEPLRLSKPKKDEYSARFKDIETIINSLNL